MSSGLGLRSAVAFVLSRTTSHDKVTLATQLDDHSIQVERRDLPTLTVIAVTDKLLDPDKVDAILRRYPRIDGIVNSGKGTHYTGTAKALAAERGVALHTFGEYISGLSSAVLLNHENGLVRAAREAFVPHSKVTKVEQVCELQLRLHRSGNMSAIDFVPTAIYTLGVAQLTTVLAAHPLVNAVVNFNNSMQYTGDAKQRAAEAGIGLFTPGEMFGALNFDGEGFRNYSGPRQTR